jgi:signal transduction histidine kinase/ActR/RegA family two-component response regulator
VLDLAKAMLDAVEEALFLIDAGGGTVLENEAGRALADRHEVMAALRTLAIEALAGPCTRSLRDGERHLTARARPVRGLSLVAVRDVSEEWARQLTLIKSEKLASLGLLSAGVGHEINNPAAFVLANLRSMKEELDAVASITKDPAGAPLRVVLSELVADCRPMLEESITGMNQIHTIARELRAFARAGDDPDSDGDVNAAIESALLMLRNELRYHVRVERSLLATLRVGCSPAHLGQVFINLILNAAQALVDAAEGRSRVRVTSFDEAGFVVAEVADNGPGMPPDVLRRIFEPQFTTKPPGIGTGLGLPISRDIIRAAGGDLTVEAAASSGATFRVRLPALPIAEPRRVPRLALAPSTRRARVLAVDDEELLLRAYRRMLGRAHDVETANGGAKAILLLEQGGRFDVILCDMNMPRMPGAELYRTVAARWPDLASRFIFLTGGALTANARLFLKETSCLWLEKPVDAEVLTQAIERKVAEAAQQSAPLHGLETPARSKS